MRQTKVNPLLLLVLAQAWCRVRPTTSPLLPQSPVPGWPVQTACPLPLRRILEGPQGDGLKATLDPAAWRRVWDHPFFSTSTLPGQEAVAPLSVRQLARGWGQPDYPVVPDLASARKRLHVLSTWKPGQSAPRALRLAWDPAWRQRLPEEVQELLRLREQLGYQVWVQWSQDAWRHTQPTEEDARQAVQLGWSWWCDPPTRADGFPEFFQAFRPLWGFWLASPWSDQWAWPWADCLVKLLAERLSGKPADRYWLEDQRMRAAWGRLDESCWRRASEVLGGEEEIDALAAQVMAEFAKVDFLGRDF